MPCCDHNPCADANVKGWLHKDWYPEDCAIDVSHFSQDIFHRLDHFKVPAYNDIDVFAIGSILYEEFSKENIPVPSPRFIFPGSREAFIGCFEQFYNRLFNDAQMEVLFAAGEPGFGRDLGYKEHGRRLGLFCLWRMCGDKEYVKYRSCATAKCPHQFALYHKLGPSHQGAKITNGVKIGTSPAFTIAQSRRWLGHQWCAFRENAPVELCKAVVSWLASIVDLYGPFCDDDLMEEDQALKRATACSRAMAEEEAAMASLSMRSCPFSGATTVRACPFSGATSSSSAAKSPRFRLVKDEMEQLEWALRESAL
jgi:hypothetical protein